MDCQQRVEQVREADALGLGHEPEQRPVAVEAPRPSLVDNLEPGLVVTVEQLVGDRAGRRLVGELERRGAEPLHADDGDQAVGMHAADGAMGLQVFKLHDSPVQVVSAGGLRRWTVLGRRPPGGFRRLLALFRAMNSPTMRTAGKRAVSTALAARKCAPVVRTSSTIAMNAGSGIVRASSIR